ncbi:hypothetical protein AMAG_13239 [Allomyces macrogynus ATCC 38327]|uniref:LSM complex subunit LSM4 n=1 Tax=Allomyces macrogynus (strain ATCC 38327) TaxID=578462 RepID=A0A0L0SZZ2_ALLM3|nr:hypothetical protein AMAG_13239 [Allomyces macrogynus ATCC 38327]|eukprot:KNE68067.1 hypothetical protein AMAG_13239 [Allomyces macrogynus ATCC 38327]
MFPLSLVNAGVGKPMRVEIKSGESYNGHLVSCDNFMNLILRDVICTSAEGDRFWKLPECYIRGHSIKYLHIPDEVLDLVNEERQNRAMQNRNNFRGRGRGGPGFHRGGGGGGRGGGAGGRRPYGHHQQNQQQQQQAPQQQQQQPPAPAPQAKA